MYRERAATRDEKKKIANVAPMHQRYCSRERNDVHGRD